MPSQSQEAKVIEFKRKLQDSEITQYLRQLLAEAESGQLCGLLAAAHYGHSDFRYTGCGTLVENSTLGMGAVLKLSQKLW